MSYKQSEIVNITFNNCAEEQKQNIKMKKEEKKKRIHFCALSVESALRYLSS